jgi:hypothetical protein
MDNTDGVVGVDHDGTGFYCLFLDPSISLQDAQTKIVATPVLPVQSSDPAVLEVGFNCRFNGENGTGIATFDSTTGALMDSGFHFIIP